MLTHHRAATPCLVDTRQLLPSQRHAAPCTTACCAAAARRSSGREGHAPLPGQGINTPVCTNLVPLVQMDEKAPGQEVSNRSGTGGALQGVSRGTTAAYRELLPDRRGGRAESTKACGSWSSGVKQGSSCFHPAGWGTGLCWKGMPHRHNSNANAARAYTPTVLQP